jgi:hypothetical protein
MIQRRWVPYGSFDPVGPSGQFLLYHAMQNILHSLHAGTSLASRADPLAGRRRARSVAVVQVCALCNAEFFTLRESEHSSPLANDGELQCASDLSEGIALLSRRYSIA